MPPKKSDPTTIHDLYAVIGKDSDGNEGIATGVDTESARSEPLIGGLKRLPRILAMAKVLATDAGVELQLVKFSSRGNLEIIKPGQDE